MSLSKYSLLVERFDLQKRKFKVDMCKLADNMFGTLLAEVTCCISGPAGSNFATGFGSFHPHQQAPPSPSGSREFSSEDDSDGEDDEIYDAIDEDKNLDEETKEKEGGNKFDYYEVPRVTIGEIINARSSRMVNNLLNIVRQTMDNDIANVDYSGGELDDGLDSNDGDEPGSEGLQNINCGISGSGGVPFEHEGSLNAGHNDEPGSSEGSSVLASGILKPTGTLNSNDGDERSEGSSTLPSETLEPTRALDSFLPASDEEKPEQQQQTDGHDEGRKKAEHSPDNDNSEFSSHHEMDHDYIKIESKNDAVEAEFDGDELKDVEEEEYNLEPEKDQVKPKKRNRSNKKDSTNNVQKKMKKESKKVLKIASKNVKISKKNNVPVDTEQSASPSKVTKKKEISAKAELLKPFICTYPMGVNGDECGHRASSNFDTKSHIRTIHFKLPRTMAQQAEKGIVDDRDCKEYIRVDEVMKKRMNEMKNEAKKLKKTMPDDDAIGTQ